MAALRAVMTHKPRPCCRCALLRHMVIDADQKMMASTRPPVGLPASSRDAIAGSLAGMPERSFETPMRIETAGLRPMLALAGTALVLGWSATAATAGTGFPEPWQLGMQGTATEIGHEVSAFH